MIKIVNASDKNLNYNNNKNCYFYKKLIFNGIIIYDINHYNIKNYMEYIFNGTFQFGNIISFDNFISFDLLKTRHLDEFKKIIKLKIFE